MNQFLITGPTGNIGREVIRYLFHEEPTGNVIAAARDIVKAKTDLTAHDRLLFRQFDFGTISSNAAALNGIDVLFLLRPPQISDVDRVFRPLLTQVKRAGIRRIVFLSVQGAARSKVIPHNKIERLIVELGFDHIFVRPSYFMQNLTTTLLSEIVEKRRITLPAGGAKFNWIDAANIGEVTARLIAKFDTYQNGAYEITGSENLSFHEVAGIMTDVLGERITYRSMGPLRFYFRKKRQGAPSDYAFVMTVLHYLPRLQQEPAISNVYREVTGKEPTMLREFVVRERVRLLGDVVGGDANHA